MRIRTVKPEFWSHPIMGKLSDAGKCMALALLNYADDDGYFLADLSLVRGSCRPYDDSTKATRDALAECHKAGWCRVVKHPEFGLLGKVVNFRKHQLINRPSPSKLATYYNSVSTHGGLSDPSLPEQGAGSRDKEQGTGSREQGNARTPEDVRREEIEKQAVEVIEHLAKTTGKGYKAPSHELRARLRDDGALVAECKLVVDWCWARWGEDPKTREWVNTVTPFRPTHWPDYLPSAQAWHAGGRKPFNGQDLTADGKIKSRYETAEERYSREYHEAVAAREAAEKAEKEGAKA